MHAPRSTIALFAATLGCGSSPAASSGSTGSTGADEPTGDGPASDETASDDGPADDAADAGGSTTTDPSATTGGDSSDGGPVDPLPCDELLDLTAALENAVALNDGYGGGVLRVATRDCVHFEGAAGTGTQGGRPLSASDGFEIASVTKTFTAALVMTYVEEGAVGLDTTIADAFGDDAPVDLLVVDGTDYTGEITMRQLLGHTSGLPDYWYDPPFVEPELNAFGVAFVADPDRFWTPPEILAYVPDLTPIGLPGAQYHYGDTGYVLLGMLVERLSGMPYHEALRARILDPVGMPDTYMTYRESAPRGLVESHRYEGTYDLYQVTRQSADWAGGGLASSTADLERFMFALVDGDILHEPSSWTAMTEWTPVGEPDVWYGLGLFRVDTGIAGDIVGHDGYGTAFMYYAPDLDAMFTGTLNQSEADWYPVFEAAMSQLAARTD